MPEVGRQFDNKDRVQQFRTAKSVPGREAPVFYANPSGRYVENPLSAHLPEPIVEHHDDGSYTTRSQHGLPGYSPTASVERPRRVEQVPLDRLESTQRYVDRRHVSNMARRKGTPPPIEVTHHVGIDRYEVSEGNHRAVLAMTKGQTHVPALVTRVTQWDR